MKRIAAVLTILLMSLDTLTAQNIPSSTTSSGESKEISALFPTKEAKLRHDVSAYLGSILGTTLHEAGMRPEDLDFDILIRTLAIELALQGQNIPEPEANETRTQAALHIMRAKMEQRNNEISAANAKRSRRFLEENAKKPGIVTTPSGLQYRIDKQGTGAPRTSSRKETDDRALYAIKYTIDTLDGPLIDNHHGTVSIIRNHTTSRLPAGFNEALKLMQPGSKWTLYIPPSIGYGEKQRNLMWLSLGERQAHFDHERICQPCIGGNSVLIVQIELVDYSPNVPLSLDEVDSVYLAANPFWSKPALAIAEMQPILAHLNEAATRTPLHPEQTQYSSQELRKITSDTIAKIWANKMIAEGLILPDIDIPTFRNQLEQSLTAPPAMADMDKQQAAASGMATHIQTRNTQESAQTWLRGKRFMKELNTVNHFDRRFMMPIRNNYLEIPCRILDEGMQDRKAAYVAPSSRFYQIKYTIRDIDGRILEDSASRIQDIRHEGYGIMSTLCAALYSENTRIGFKGVFYISPSAGFGEERTLSNDGIPIPGNSTLIVELEFLGTKTGD